MIRDMIKAFLRQPAWLRGIEILIAVTGLIATIVFGMLELASNSHSHTSPSIHKPIPEVPSNQQYIEQLKCSTQSIRGSTEKEKLVEMESCGEVNVPNGLVHRGKWYYFISNWSLVTITTCNSFLLLTPSIAA